MACVFDGNGQIPLVLRICPKYWISLEKKWHLLSFIESFAEYNDVVQISYCEVEVFQDIGH